VCSVSERFRSQTNLTIGKKWSNLRSPGHKTTFPVLKYLGNIITSNLENNLKMWVKSSGMGLSINDVTTLGFGSVNEFLTTVLKP
jgi:hypothetical protein